MMMKRSSLQEGDRESAVGESRWHSVDERHFGVGVNEWLHNREEAGWNRASCHQSSRPGAYWHGIVPGVNAVDAGAFL
ncbi:MAG TPA: hypothetical protein DHW02_24750 [Ktedonobacter sp.]|nr:hypothetical protein [Ktedonobacter sp.]